MNSTIGSTAFVIGLLVATPTIVSCAASQTAESTGEYLDDAAITAKVKNQLLQAKDVSVMHVGVETHKGHVQLSGFVSTQDEKIKAERVAHDVPGVKSVLNDLIVNAE